MFSFPRRTQAVSSFRQARPFLERLEDRCSPANLTMNIAYGSEHMVTLSGQLTGAGNNANQLVKLSGVVSGSTTTDTNGNYTINLKASALGSLTAVATNPQTQQTDAQANATLVDNGPVISNFKAVEEGSVIVFTGKVTDNWDPSGLVVTLGGDPMLNGVTATVNADGTFSVGVPYHQIDYSFTATAQTTDSWDEASNQATTVVNIT
jgi:hypothetical protein